MEGLSILIPTYNDECFNLAAALQRQCSAALTGEAAMPYEIIVMDDGSTSSAVVNDNRRVAALPCCRFVRSERNMGRAVVRNRLATIAQYNWLLFIDCGRELARQDFISTYLDYIKRCGREKRIVVYGGYTVPEQAAEGHKLRYRYERAMQRYYTAERRQRHQYQHFNTCNILMTRELWIAIPFDENFRYYGYEDVDYGRELHNKNINVRHIDNPLALCRFETNDEFVRKTEEQLRTLARFRKRLKGYSRLLTITGILGFLHLNAIAGHALKPLLPRLRRNLTGNNPSLTAFTIYKLAYFENI